MGRYLVVKPDSKNFSYELLYDRYSIVLYFSSLFNKTRFMDKIDKKLLYDYNLIKKRLNYPNNFLITEHIIEKLLYLKYYNMIEQRGFYIEIIKDNITYSYNTLNENIIYDKI